MRDDLYLKYSSELYPLSEYQIQPPVNDKLYNNPTCVDDFLQYVYLYVIYNFTTQLFKIGISKNPYNRIRQLRTQSGCKLHMYFNIAFECNYDEHNKIAEEYLHKYFSSKRVSGEWFLLNSRDLVKIRYWADRTLELNYYPLTKKIKKYEPQP